MEDQVEANTGSQTKCTILFNIIIIVFIMFVMIIVVIIKISIIVLIIIIILIIMIILKVKMCTIEKSRDEVRSKLVLERDKGTSRYRLELGPTKIFGPNEMRPEEAG